MQNPQSDPEAVSSQAPAQNVASVAQSAGDHAIQIGQARDVTIYYGVGSPPAASAGRDTQAEPPDNPFFTGGRIREAGQFFGRQRLLREMRGELQKRCSVSLMGAAQMGKSSLLYYLYLTRAGWLPETTLLYLDLQAVLDEADFCETTLRALGESGDSLGVLRAAHAPLDQGMPVR